MKKPRFEGPGALVAVGLLLGVPLGGTLLATLVDDPVAWVASDSRSDWLGFFGALLGAGATIAAGAIAWLATIRAIDHSRREKAVERLLAHRVTIMKVNRHQQIARANIDADPGAKHPGTPKSIDKFFDFIESRDVMAVCSDVLLRGDITALNFYILQSEVSIYKQFGVAADRGNVIVQSLAIEVMHAINRRIERVESGEDITSVSRSTIVGLAQYTSHASDGTPIDISHIHKIAEMIPLNLSESIHSAASG